MPHNQQSNRHEYDISSRSSVGKATVDRIETKLLVSLWLFRSSSGKDRLLTREDRVHTYVIPCGFMKEKMALGQVLLGVLQFSSVNIIPPVLHNLLMYHLKGGQ
jgi:hypothetical protein